MKWHNCVDSSGVWQYSVWHAAGVVMCELLHVKSNTRYTSEEGTGHWFQWPSTDPESEVSCAEFNPGHPISDLLNRELARLQEVTA